MTPGQSLCCSAGDGLLGVVSLDQEYPSAMSSWAFSIWLTEKFSAVAHHPCNASSFQPVLPRFCLSLQRRYGYGKAFGVYPVREEARLRAGLAAAVTDMPARQALLQQFMAGGGRSAAGKYQQ